MLSALNYIFIQAKFQYNRHLFWCGLGGLHITVGQWQLSYFGNYEGAFTFTLLIATNKFQ